MHLVMVNLASLKDLSALKLSDRSIDHYHAGQLSVTDKSMNTPSNDKPGLIQCPLKLTDRTIDHNYVRQLSVTDESKMMNAPSNSKTDLTQCPLKLSDNVN